MSSDSRARGRLNAVCPYYTMFPPDFPLRRLREAGAGDWVLDPFCGRGTTGFAARLLGLPSVGVDTSPVAVAIAAAKLVDTTPEAVTALAREAVADPAGDADRPEGEFWDLCFHPRTLSQIVRVRRRLLERCQTPQEVMLRAILMGVLHGPRTSRVPSYLSNQMPRTFASKPGPAVAFWRRHGMEPPQVDLVELVERRARHVLADPPPVTDGSVIMGDSREVGLAELGPRFRWVLTSPPYVGMRTYVPDQWLRRWLIGGPAHVDYSQDGQIGRSTGGQFVEELARVWRNVAAACAPGARLVVRFGALPSIPVDHVEILSRSLDRSGAPWEVLSVEDAGASTAGRRQAPQFRRPAGNPRREIDLVARLAA